MANPIKQIFAKRSERSAANLFEFEGAVPVSKSILFSLQHLLALFVSNIAPIIVLVAAVQGSNPDFDAKILENGVRVATLLAGIGTLLQMFPLWKFGGRLPVFMGASFTFLGVLELIVSTYSWQTAFLSVIIGGGFLAIVGLFAKYWVKFIKPIVSAVVVLALGLSLLPVAIQQFVGISDIPSLAAAYDWSIGWKYILIAFVSLLSSLVFQIFVKGLWKHMSIVVGLIVGYIVSLCIPGLVDFSALSFSKLTDFIDVPRPIFTFLRFSSGDFNLGAIIAVCILFLVSSTETIGAVSVVASGSFGREAKPEELAGGISCVGLVGALAGLFGGVPVTSYLQNSAIVNQTEVKNRNALVFMPLALILFSFFPLFSSILLTIPSAVFGGLMVNLFGGIVYSGMKMIFECEHNVKNTTVVALSLGIGFGLTFVPSVTEPQFSNDILNSLMLILQAPVVSMFLVSMILSYAIPKRIDEPKNEEK